MASEVALQEPVFFISEINQGDQLRWWRATLTTQSPSHRWNYWRILTDIQSQYNRDQFWSLGEDFQLKNWILERAVEFCWQLRACVGKRSFILWGPFSLLSLEDHMCCFSDSFWCNWTRNHNHLVLKWTLNQFGQMVECSFKN